jgi:hypothetical protein
MRILSVNPSITMSGIRLFFVVVLASIGFGSIGIRSATAQELDCKVTVNIQTLSEEERITWQTFKQDVEAYLNTFSWTTNFSGEKIQCSMTFNITGSGSTVTSQLFVQSTRKLAGSNEVTTIARFLDDKASFAYYRGMPLQHGVNYRQLETLLDFYANLIIGLDFDSYESLSGTAAFQNAQSAALVANSSQGAGWDRLITVSGAFSRMGYIEDIMNANTRTTRNIWYMYHTQVLDKIAATEDLAKLNYATVIDTLILIKRQSSELDRSVYYKTILDSKYAEFADLGRWFKDNADLYFRKLKYLDASHSTFYDDARAKLN